jgi:hypothetical protein
MLQSNQSDELNLAREIPYKNDNFNEAIGSYITIIIKLAKLTKLLTEPYEIPQYTTVFYATEMSMSVHNGLK